MRTAVRPSAVRLAAMAAAVALSALPARAGDTLEAMAEYLMFADYVEGVIMPHQVTAEVAAEATFVDTRSADEYAAGHIPGALNVEWRETLDRIEEIPETGLVILYCNTGTLSAQAAFALRVAGRTNVVTLQTGWRPEELELAAN